MAQNAGTKLTVPHNEEPSTPFDAAVSYLRSDYAARATWTSAIAMSFRDEFSRRYPRDGLLPGKVVQEIADTAAENFLNLLVGK